jgi:hypothetical protein
LSSRATEQQSSSFFELQEHWIFIPRGYFQFPVQRSFSVIDEDDYHVIRLGAGYSELRKALVRLHSEILEVWINNKVIL